MTNHRLTTTFVFTILLGLLTNLFGQPQRTLPPASATPTPNANAIRELTVDEVLGWRNSFVLGGDLSIARDKYGAPDEMQDFPDVQGAPTRWDYKGNARTNNRSLVIWARKSKADLVKIYPASYERLDVERVLLEGWQFCFTTGVSVLSKTGITQGQFYATSRDGTAQIFFSVDEGISSVQAHFYYVEFHVPDAETPTCDRPEPGANSRPRTF